MKETMIKEKLVELDVHIEDIVLGDFDVIGEYTAKKNRSPNSELYSSVGCFFSVFKVFHSTSFYFEFFSVHYWLGFC